MEKKGDGELGARFEGAVLTGEMSVDENLRDDGVRAKLPSDDSVALPVINFDLPELPAGPPFPPRW
jgi:hypothetical protein